MQPTTKIALGLFFAFLHVGANSYYGGLPAYSPHLPARISEDLKNLTSGDIFTEYLWRGEKYGMTPEVVQDLKLKVEARLIEPLLDAIRSRDQRAVNTLVKEIEKWYRPLGEEAARIVAPLEHINYFTRYGKTVNEDAERPPRDRYNYTQVPPRLHAWESADPVMDWEQAPWTSLSENRMDIDEPSRYEPAFIEGDQAPLPTMDVDESSDSEPSVEEGSGIQLAPMGDTITDLSKIKMGGLPTARLAKQRARTKSGFGRSKKGTRAMPAKRTRVREPFKQCYSCLRNRAPSYRVKPVDYLKFLEEQRYKVFSGLADLEKQRQDLRDYLEMFQRKLRAGTLSEDANDVRKQLFPVMAGIADLDTRIYRARRRVKALGREISLLDQRKMGDAK